MALPGYNSEEGHETPSLLDTLIGIVSSSWEEGTNWIEETGTEFLESFPETDSPYKEGRKWSEFTDEEKDVILSGGDEATQLVFDTMGGGLGRIAGKGFQHLNKLTASPKLGPGNSVGKAKAPSWGAAQAELNIAQPTGKANRTVSKPTKPFAYSKTHPALNKVPTNASARLENIKEASKYNADGSLKNVFEENPIRGQSSGEETLARLNRVRQEALIKLDKGAVPGQQPFNRPGGGLAKQADARLVKAREGFAFNKGFDPIAYMREAKTPNQVMASWDAIRHKFSNYDAQGTGLNYKQHEAWAKEMYTMFADALKSQGLPHHAKIIMHQLSQRGKKVKQSYNSTLK
jgi:hypothetical protein